MSETDEQIAKRFRTWAAEHKEAPRFGDLQPIEDDPRWLARLASSIARSLSRPTD